MTTLEPESGMRSLVMSRRSNLTLVVTPIFAALATAVFIGEAAAQQPVRVYISADMEGVAGAVTPEQLGPGGFEYQRFREFMTGEVFAAIEGAREGGATEIVVSDSHGNMQNLLIDRLPDDVRVIRGSPRPLSMMEGIDASFDAVIFIGYHSAATNLEGVRAHTFSSARYAAVELNGVPQSESSYNAAIAGHFGVPVVMISGDDIAVAEFQQVVPGVEGAVVKRAIGFHAAETLTPAAAQALIRERARDGVRNRASIPPFRVEAPLTVDLTFQSYRPAEILAYLPIVERPSDRTIRYRADSIVDIARFLVFVGAYAASLEP